MNLNINLTYLKFFHDAVMMGSISESAKRNFVSQSAISQGIAKLEHVLSVNLFQYKKPSLKLTAEGQLVYLGTRNIFSSIRDLYKSLDARLEEPQLPINFVTTHSIGFSLLPLTVMNFKKDYPRSEVNFQFAGLSQVRQLLKQGIAEFALALDSSNLEDFDFLPIKKGNFKIFCRKKDLDKEITEIFVEDPKGTAVPELCKQYKSLKNPIPSLTSFNNWEFIARCLVKGGGFGFFPDFIVSRYPELIATQTQFSVPYTFGVIYPKQDALSPSAKIFISFLKRELES